MNPVLNAAQASELARKIIPPNAGMNAVFHDAARHMVQAEIVRQAGASDSFDPLGAAMHIREAAAGGDATERAASDIACGALEAVDRGQRRHDPR